MKKIIIAAVADNNAIGIKGELPWHISADLKYFKQQTKGCPVIMGRNTFESIGRPLPGRTNIILSSKPIDSINSTSCLMTASSLMEAFCFAENCKNSEDIVNSLSIDDNKQVAHKEDAKCFIIGGAKVYTDSMPLADELYITHVHTTIADADTFFPIIDPNIWTLTSKSELFTDENSGLEFEFCIYQRISKD